MQEAAEGAITIELESRRIVEFDSYMLGLTVENNDRNPWFRDYWEAVFECKIRNDSSRTEKDNSSLPTCSQNLNISATKDGYKQENKVRTLHTPSKTSVSKLLEQIPRLATVFCPVSLAATIFFGAVRWRRRTAEQNCRCSAVRKVSRENCAFALSLAV